MCRGSRRNNEKAYEEAIPSAERFSMSPPLCEGPTVFPLLAGSRLQSPTFAELLIDCEEDRTLRAVLVGMLREGDRNT